MVEYLIEAVDVSYTNVDYEVVNNINLKIKKDSFTSIIGKSGSGKSTLLKLLAGILIPDNGKIIINSKDINQLEGEHLISFKKKIGFVFQDAALISNLSIKENLILPLDFHYPKMDKNENEKIINDLLKKVDMDDCLNERPAQLSMGEKKLISFVRAMLLKPELLFLDEPLSSLDATTAIKMIDLCEEYSTLENTTIIAVTNLKTFIHKLADRIIYLENKTIALDKSIKEIYSTNPSERPQIINDLLSK
ncbi:MAG: ATP-binding cassette domain-containing protein [Spirochaetes bacterium]|nr:ATP-binding cassette domain-containing protein [Spirochaetota bacterium]